MFAPGISEARFSNGASGDEKRGQSNNIDVKRQKSVSASLA